MKKEEEVKDEPVFMERPKIEKSDADDDEGGIFRSVNFISILSQPYIIAIFS